MKHISQNEDRISFILGLLTLKYDQTASKP